MTKKLFAEIEDAENVASVGTQLAQNIIHLSAEPAATQSLLRRLTQIVVEVERKWLAIERREDFQYENRREALKVFNATQKIRRLEE